MSLVSGFRKAKVHAVDPDTARNRAMMRETGEVPGHCEAMSLCGWPVMVGDVEFSDNGLACRNCAAVARNREG